MILDLVLFWREKVSLKKLAEECFMKSLFTDVIAIPL